MFDILRNSMDISVFGIERIRGIVVGIVIKRFYVLLLVL